MRDGLIMPGTRYQFKGMDLPLDRSDGFIDQSKHIVKTAPWMGMPMQGGKMNPWVPMLLERVQTLKLIRDKGHIKTGTTSSRNIEDVKNLGMK